MQVRATKSGSTSSINSLGNRIHLPTCLCLCELNGLYICASVQSCLNTRLKLNSLTVLHPSKFQPTNYVFLSGISLSIIEALCFPYAQPVTLFFHELGVVLTIIIANYKSRCEGRICRDSSQQLSGQKVKAIRANKKEILIFFFFVMTKAHHDDLEITAGMRST